MNEAEAEAMESIERAAMAAMGLHDPYQDDPDAHGHQEDDDPPR
jgi:hypothetical protein